MAPMAGNCIQDVLPHSKDWKYASHRMRDTIMQHNNGIPLSDYIIKKVSKISNASVDARFNARKASIEQEIGGMSEIWETFHGTPFAKAIAKEGFNVSKSSSVNMFGKGVYFAPHSSKSNQYAWGVNGGCQSHGDKACTECTRTMLICMCVMGRQFKPNKPKDEPPVGFHSIVADPLSNPNIAHSLKYPEYVIKDGDQVKPVFIVEYTIVDDCGGQALGSFQSAVSVMKNPQLMDQYLNALCTHDDSSSDASSSCVSSDDEHDSSSQPDSINCSQDESGSGSDGALSSSGGSDGSNCSSSDEEDGGHSDDGGVSSSSLSEANSDRINKSQDSFESCSSSTEDYSSSD